MSSIFSLGSKRENVFDSCFFSEEPTVKPSLSDMPCDTAMLQWWYFNAHLRDLNKEKDFSFFASYFRQKDQRGSKENVIFVDSCVWALIDVGEEKYYSDSLLDYKAHEIIIDRLETAAKGENDGAYARNVVLEMAKRGRLPLPDRAMSKAAVYSEDRFHINYDDQCMLEGEGDGAERRYKLYLNNPRCNITVELEFAAITDPVLHGESGIVNEMFYYYYPSMSVEGRISVDDSVTHVKGDGWYDREYGGSENEIGRDALDAWSWFSLHLSDGSQLSIFDIVDSQTKQQKERVAVLTFDGTKKVCRDVTLEEEDWWTSLVTFVEYPLKFHIEILSFQLTIDIHTSFNHQEVPTILVSGGFYEGRVTGEGYRKGTPVSVIGFYERKNLGTGGDASVTLKHMGEYVRKTLSIFYPLHASNEWVNKNVLGRYCTGKGVVAQHVCDSLFLPVRSIIDRGGKAWRSLVLVSACNALSSDYFDCTKYIAITELLHVGSLIIDDIQDNSYIRRGGKSAHLEYGVPTAINAGTACYFMGISFAEIQSLPMEKANKVYEIYFDVMKAGHAGQGMDIYGLHYLMPEAVRTGKSEALEDALKAIHTYKTGAVAAATCRVACILCDANEEVTAAMEAFGLGLGLAFQIVDDALNVKGFEGDLKEAGEDIRDGKITYPVAKAMGRLELPQRERVWSILQEHTSDSDKIGEVVKLLYSVNAIQDCLVDAQKLVDEKWSVLDPLIPDSMPKVMMRTFCLFLTKRGF
ncbi:putative polyprenyl synthase [Trypanosoma rangeli]|uniref:Putative polyprenyl synthase n=1 Tax=Trypanosoma rangeli TaxID=5698 RepID=A0A422ND06_TRYRA|nr:putative polyprenyl synthase [Trypanosoma rangeli]RNF03316.1 putative polyprenyl synthase [Trypanosoma rangeli]|eukprot:RNF03316.1 putative polyprenyl synthase [Trypanosoma rangeli]